MNYEVLFPVMGEGFFVLQAFYGIAKQFITGEDKNFV
jgi:hypothetical protein